MKKQTLLILILGVIAAAALLLSAWLLFSADKGPVLAPDLAPETEANAQTIPNEPSETLENPADGGSISLTFAREVDIDLKKKSVDLIFGNPGKSNQSMVLQLVIQDVVVMQSGTLQPGTQVTDLPLLQDADQQLQAGTYDGLFHVICYDLASGEKSIVNTEIPVTVTVR